MSDVLIYFILRLCIILVHVICYSFNSLLVFVVVKRKETWKKVMAKALRYSPNNIYTPGMCAIKTKVYIFTMIAGEVLQNLSQNFVVEVAWFMDDDQKDDYYGNYCYGALLVNQVSYHNRFFVLLLMAINRLCLVVNPNLARFLTQSYLKLYVISIWTFLVVVHSASYLFSCNITYVWRLFSWTSSCPYQSYSYAILFVYMLPFVILGTNIVVIIYVRFRRSSIRHDDPAKRAPRLSKGSQAARQDAERALVLHTLLISIFLSVDGIYSSLVQQYFVKEFRASPRVVQEVLASTNTYASSNINILIYFLCDSFMRSCILEFIGFRKPKVLTVSGTVT